MSETNPHAPKYPVIVQHPTFADIKANFSGNDYLQWGGVTAASFPLGYIFGSKLHQRVARPSMWVTGFLGSLGGFLWAYQNSSFRLQGYTPNAAEVKRYIPAARQQQQEQDE